MPTVITEKQLIKSTNCSPEGLGKHYPSLMAACEDRGITTAKRLAAFLANAVHETNGFRAFMENLNYSAEGLLKTWPKRFTPALAKQMERRPEQIANHVYGGRYGNINPGDGWKYRGRGIFQTTFKDNYIVASSALGYDFVLDPDTLATPPFAAKSAAYYWHIKGLNYYADREDLRRITLLINGGLHGLADRVLHYQNILKVI